MNDQVAEFEANFSVLERYGEDVTANEYITNPAIGRDNQIKELMLILLTPEKSAILIGKPGIGKTAIVEGLAYRLQKGEVPPALQGYTIINIKTASLLGVMPSGESKVQKMIDELKQKEKVILFIDEVHMLIGATDSSSLDFANIFKEGLGRGSIKVIGATTTEEYERYILRDKAFTRRFQKVDVPEPTREETIEIMMGSLPKFEKTTGRKMKYTDFDKSRIMAFLVDLTGEYKRVFAIGSRYPDICLTLLKQAFSYTVYDDREYMDIFDVRKAIENTKNVYPDVIKKELPKFEVMFKDLILEEKGQKPIEEWKRSSAPTRYEHEAHRFEESGVEDKDSPVQVKPKIELIPEYQEANRPRMISLSAETLNRMEKTGPKKISDVLERNFQETNVMADIDNILLGAPIKKKSFYTPEVQNDEPIIEDTPIVGLDILNVNVNEVKNEKKKQDFLDLSKKPVDNNSNKQRAANRNREAFEIYQLEQNLPQVSVYESGMKPGTNSNKFIDVNLVKEENPIPKNTGFLDIKALATRNNSPIMGDEEPKKDSKPTSLLMPNNTNDEDDFYDDFYDRDE